MPGSRPPYALLRQHYPDPVRVPAAELFRQIGHPEKSTDHSWQNTCAIRVSLALLATGMPIPDGFLLVKAGAYRGRKVEIMQSKLATLLTAHWGEPEKFPGALLNESVGQRKGIIRFLNLWGPFDPQGHIDLISPDQRSRLMCAGYCYWAAVQCWFWECP